jgi:F-type H+-transporting ATPase subunit delta
VAKRAFPALIGRKPYARGSLPPKGQPATRKIGWEDHRTVSGICGFSRRQGRNLERKEKRVDVAQSSSPVSGVAERYALSLFELARDEGQVDAVEAELNQFARLIDENADFRHFVESPLFSAEEQVAAVAAIVGETRPSPLTGNFLKVVAANRRLFALPPMIRAFRQMASAYRGEVEAEVVSAHALSDEQRRQLAETLGQYAKKTVNMRESVDPAILGGLVVKIGSRQIDTSLRTKLNSLKLALKEAR